MSLNLEQYYGSCGQFLALGSVSSPSTHGKITMCFHMHTSIHYAALQTAVGVRELCTRALAMSIVAIIIA